MKKNILTNISLIVVICAAVAFGGCAHGFKNAGKLHYVEWSDEAGKINFRVAENYHGYGYIVLGDKKLDAEFQLLGYKSAINVVICAKDLDENDPRDEINSSFSVSDVDGDGKIKSGKDDVVLFGYHFGKVTLSYRQLSREDCQAWEYSYGWDNDKKLFIDAKCNAYAKYKCFVNCYTVLNGAVVYVVFKWLPDEKGFALYDDGIPVPEIDDATERLAEGTYDFDGDTLTLKFTKDNLFFEDNLVLTYRAMA